LYQPLTLASTLAPRLELNICSNTYILHTIQLT
jgi:hypothetical protein